MNYRHIFHAGNFADVFKHIVLTRVLAYLQRKPTALRVIDTHAGAGIYDLASPEAERTGEAGDGVRRFDRARFPSDVDELLTDYRRALAAVRVERGPDAYPGSPEIARRLLRPEDRLLAFETAERPQSKLAALFSRDRRAKALALDGWLGLKANIPPKERRGLILIDPPYEDVDEFETVASQVGQAWKKWPQGIGLVWYPVADEALVTQFVARMREEAGGDILRAELRVRAQGIAQGLASSGLLVLNPPFTLEAELTTILPHLCQCLASGSGARWRVGRLADGRVAGPGLRREGA